MLAVPFYTKNLEQISLVSTIFCLCQLLISINVMMNYAFETSQFGYALNSLLINPFLLALHLYAFFVRVGQAKTY